MLEKSENTSRYHKRERTHSLNTKSVLIVMWIVVRVESVVSSLSLSSPILCIFPFFSPLVPCIIFFFILLIPLFSFHSFISSLFAPLLFSLLFLLYRIGMDHRGSDSFSPFSSSIHSFILSPLFHFASLTIPLSLPLIHPYTETGHNT